MSAQKIGGASHTHDIRNAATDGYFPFTSFNYAFVSFIALMDAQTVCTRLSFREPGYEASPRGMCAIYLSIVLESMVSLYLLCMCKTVVGHFSLTKNEQRTAKKMRIHCRSSCRK